MDLITGALEMQCTAMAKRTGERCAVAAIIGGRVCWHHGGAAQQVRRKAAERVVMRQAYAAVGKIRAERAKMLAED